MQIQQRIHSAYYTLKCIIIHCRIHRSGRMDPWRFRAHLIQFLCMQMTRKDVYSMKTTIKKMDYDKVMALPRPEHKLPQKPNLFWRGLIRFLTIFGMMGTKFRYETEGFEKISEVLRKFTIQKQFQKYIFTKNRAIPFNIILIIIYVYCIIIWYFYRTIFKKMFKFISPPFLPFWVSFGLFLNK